MLDLLLEYANGLDTAGSYESSYFEDWYQSLRNGAMTPNEIMKEIRLRYTANNPEVIKEFEAANKSLNSTSESSAS